MDSQSTHDKTTHTSCRADERTRLLRNRSSAESSRGGGVGGGSVSRAWRSGPKGIALPTKIGVLESNTSRTGGIQSVVRSVWIRSVSFFCCSSCCRSARILRQRGHGCFPSNVLTMAVPNESRCKKTAIIRVHATDCRTNQCPPIITRIAITLATHPAL
jgi:hypothetical protein